MFFAAGIIIILYLGMSGTSPIAEEMLNIIFRIFENIFDKHF
ncbi:exported hypothetical protein [Candidatus Terasakiella magnetica]|uniref:Uncharacterized protein n=1 Tax=Candidatus Terasakiella magnetica TaxID=1867952 RepID=A0A1C3RLC8_9PROT|nr:exported hypothetical protein [Candidatus Terasakiella magnetica]